MKKKFKLEIFKQFGLYEDRWPGEGGEAIRWYIK